MKSQLFSKHDLVREENFAKDMKVLFGMTPDVLGRLPEHALKAIEAPTRAEADSVYEAAAKALQLPRMQLDHALDIARFFLRELAPKGKAASDDPEALVDDLKELFDLSEDKRQAMRSFLENSKSLAQQKVALTLLQAAHAQATLPILESVSVKADLRGVFDESYKYEDDVSAFSPNFLGTIPIGIVELRIHGGETETVFFQLSKRTLQILMDYLLALQKQIDLLESAITTKKS